MVLTFFGYFWKNSGAISIELWMSHRQYRKFKISNRSITYSVAFNDVTDTFTCILTRVSMIGTSSINLFMKIDGCLTLILK